MDAKWKLSELQPEEVVSWRDAGALDPVRTLELIEAGWSPDMGRLPVDFGGAVVSIAAAVSLGMTLDEAERELADIRRAARSGGAYTG